MASRDWKALLARMARQISAWPKTPVAVPRAEPGPAKPSARVVSGKYLSLYTYLVNRYADTVVLTFADIEDLLGSKLPEQARLGQEWWLNTDSVGERASHSDSWKLARRTAKPNLLSQTVMFTRT